MTKKHEQPLPQEQDTAPDTAAEETVSADDVQSSEQETDTPEETTSAAQPDESAAELKEAPADTEKTAAESADAADTASQEEQFSFKTLVRDVKGLLARYELPEMLLTRCIALYFILSGVWVIYFRQKLQIRPVDNWREFVTNMTEGGGHILGSVIFLVAGFITLSSLSSILPKKARILDQTAAIAGVLFFDFTMLWRVNNFFMTAAVAFVSLVFIYYALCKMPNRLPFRKLPWTFCGIIALAATVGMTFFIASGTIYRHMVFGTACHDFGLFVQMYHYLTQGIHAYTTCERDHLLSHFNVHSSYIYYVLVPFYKAIPKESTLLAAQAVLAMGGAIPTFFIAKRHNIKGAALTLLTFAYTFALSVVCPCFYDFHENAFLPTLLMWLFFAIDRKNWIMTWIMSVLVCIVKEDAPLYIVCIGLFIFFEMKDDRNRWQGIAMTALSGAYMMFITRWLTANGDGSAMTATRFGNMIIDPNGGLGEVIRNVLLDPSYFFSLLIHESTLNFFLKVMLPLLFTPFLTKKIHRYWLMVPFIIMNLTIGAGYGYAADVDFHYIFGPFCLLLYTTILNLDDFGTEKQHDLSVLLGSAAMIFFVGLPLHHVDAKESYINSNGGFQQVEEALDAIPQDGVVIATPFLLSHCADRNEIYLLDFNDTNRDDVERTEDRLIDMDKYDFYVFGPGTEIGIFTESVLEANGWTVFREVPGRAVIYQNPAYSG